MFPDMTPEPLQATRYRNEPSYDAALHDYWCTRCSAHLTAPPVSVLRRLVRGARRGHGAAAAGARRADGAHGALPRAEGGGRGGRGLEDDAALAGLDVAQHLEWEEGEL